MDAKLTVPDASHGTRDRGVQLRSMSNLVGLGVDREISQDPTPILGSEFTRGPSAGPDRYPSHQTARIALGTDFAL